MRQLLGYGTPPTLAAAAERLFALISSATVTVWGALHTTLWWRDEGQRPRVDDARPGGALHTILGDAAEKRASLRDADGGLWAARITHSSTGC
jgi:hypothetical protein